MQTKTLLRLFLRPLAATAFLGAFLATAQAQTPPPNAEAQAVQQAMGTVDKVLSAVEGFAAEATGPVQAKAGEQVVPGNSAAALARKRSLERMLLMISSGAAAGAAIGAATSKNSKGAMIGAAVGGVAGLIYEQISTSQAAKQQVTP